MLLLVFSVLVVPHCAVCIELIFGKATNSHTCFPFDASCKESFFVVVVLFGFVLFFPSTKWLLGATKTFVNTFYKGVIFLHGQRELDFCSNLNELSHIGENGLFKVHIGILNV